MCFCLIFCPRGCGTLSNFSSLNWNLPSLSTWCWNISIVTGLICPSTALTTRINQPQTFCCIRLMAKFSKILRVNFEDWQNSLGFQVQLGSDPSAHVSAALDAHTESLQPLPLTDAQFGKILAFFTLHSTFQGISEERWGQNFRKKKNSSKKSRQKFRIFKENKWT